MYGKRKMLLWCLAMQLLGSALDGLGTSLALVVAGRAAKGFAAALIPVGISILRDELPCEKVNGAVALMSATLGIGSAAGLPLAGVIYAHTTWHALFWVSAVMATAMAVAVWFVVPESSVRTPGAFDAPGAVVLSAALVCLLLPLSKGGHWGWTSEPTLTMFVLSTLLLAAWIPWELRTRTPMVDLRTAARRSVALTNAASLMVGFSMYGNMLSTTQLLQMPQATGYGFGLSVLAAGLCMIPSGLAMLVFSPVSARITRAFGGRVTLLVGALVLVGGYVSRVFLISSLWHVVVGALLVSVGTAIAYASMPTLIMGSVPITETASANGFNSLLRSIGTAGASAAVAAILTSQVMPLGAHQVPTLQAFKHIFWLCSAAALVAALLAALLPSSTPRPVAVAGPTPDEMVVKGTVLGLGHGDEEQRAVRSATVTVTDLDGVQVDWSRVDADGSYAVVLPQAGRYLAITAADGWAPHAQLLDIRAAHTHDVQLGRRLDVTGVVRHGGTPVAEALVTLTRLTGESVAATHTGPDGSFRLPLGSHGRHVLTALAAESGQVASITITLTGQAVAVQLDLADPAVATQAVGALPRRGQ